MSEPRAKRKASRPRPAAFPKSSRLIRSADFHFDQPKKWRVDGFQFVYSLNGRGRLGISISKKVLRRANSRNRIRRLMKEAFRQSPLRATLIDLHVVGTARLSEIWEDLGVADILGHFSKLADSVLRSGVVKKDPDREKSK